MRSSAFVQHESFEPIVATLSFTFWFTLWWALETFWPRWLAQYACGQDSQRENRAHPARSSWRWQGFRDSRLLNEGLWYILPLLVLDRLFPRRTLPIEAPTGLRLGCVYVGLPPLRFHLNSRSPSAMERRIPLRCG